MKLRPTSYTFDASAQTIICAEFSSLEAIQLITNVTDNIIIYNFADPTKGGTLSSTTLTLTYDTTSMADADKLQILIEDGSTTIDIGDTDVTSVIPGTGATNLGKAIDTATGATDTGVLALATRDDALSALTPIEGDNVQLRTDANGALWTHDDALDAALSGSELQVDIVGSLPAGTNAIGKLASNTGVDIGDVDITSIAAGDNNIGNVDIASIAAGDNNIGNVDLASAIPAGTNNIGDVDVLSIVPGSGATNLGKAEDGGHTSGDVGVMALGVRNDTPNVAIAGTDLDYAPIATSKTGAVYVMSSEEDFAVLGSNKVNKTFNLTGAQTDAIIWSPAAGKRWYITDIHYVVSAAATVTFEDDLVAGDAVVGIGGAYAANSGLSRSFKTPVFSNEDAADLLLTTTAGNIQGIVTGYEI